MCHANNEKRETSHDRRKIKKKIKTFGDKETYKYLGILEAHTIKQLEMKENIKKEYLRSTRTLFET